MVKEFKIKEENRGRDENRERILCNCHSSDNFLFMVYCINIDTRVNVIYRIELYRVSTINFVYHN